MPLGSSVSLHNLSAAAGVDLFALLNDSVLGKADRDKKSVSVAVEGEGEADDQKLRNEFVRTLNLFGRNDTTWDDNRRAAVAIHEALNLYGMKYQSAPPPRTRSCPRAPRLSTICSSRDRPLRTSAAIATNLFLETHHDTPRALCDVSRGIWEDGVLLVGANPTLDAARTRLDIVLITSVSYTCRRYR
ncbi:MAG: hypothetical protein NTU62_01085 [Spirochaetes bacterium]|nr:hypothetical protein [Spirochaetota bacterium]